MIIIFNKLVSLTLHFYEGDFINLNILKRYFPNIIYLKLMYHMDLIYEFMDNLLENIIELPKSLETLILYTNIQIEHNDDGEFFDIGQTFDIVQIYNIYKLINLKTLYIDMSYKSIIIDIMPLIYLPCLTELNVSRAQLKNEQYLPKKVNITYI